MKNISINFDFRNTLNSCDYQNSVDLIKNQIEWRNKHANIPEKSGLLYINEEAKNIGYRAIKYLIAKFTKSILENKSMFLCLYLCLIRGHYI